MSENERFDNPVDRKTYVAEGGWHTYEPKEPQKREDIGRIHTELIWLLTAENEIAERTSVKAFAAFARLAEASAQKTLQSVKEEATVLAQFSCTPGKHTVQLAHQGTVTQDELQSLYNDLLSLEPMPVSSGEISFQLTIQIEPKTPE